MNAKQLIDEYKKLHGPTSTQFLGYTLMSYKNQVVDAIREAGAKTVLDWGCGKGEAWVNWQSELGLREVYRYDPGVKHFAVPPAERLKFDLVVCCDVLEHLLEPDAEALVPKLFDHAKKGVWASVCCRAAKKTFPDGTNMHVTIKPITWWQQLFAAEAERTGVPYWLVETP